MWTCSKCQKDLDDSVAWDCFPPDYQKVCLGCKWFPNEATPEKLEFKLWCPYCNNSSVPCEIHAEICATMKAVESLKEFRKKKYKDEADSSPVTDEEDMFAERIKQETLQYYNKHRCVTTSSSNSTKDKKD